MRLSRNVLVIWIVLLNWLGVENTFAVDLDTFGMALLRYESESNLGNKPDRERIRLIGRIGSRVKFNQVWSATARLSTGLKNKQNVPAHTIKRLSNQPQPDSDVYVDQYFINYQRQSLRVVLGKAPWLFTSSTDIFWDRDLNPYTAYAEYRFSDSQSLSAAFIKPLDGEVQTVGEMLVAQYRLAGEYESVKWSLAPWFVDFSGENNAQFAKQDTAYDHRSLRLSGGLKYKKMRLGIDLGYAFHSGVQDTALNTDSNQNKSAVIELGYGALKSVNDWQWHLRYMHVERFSVITEFGQNAIAAQLTSDFSGWDLRARHKVAEHLWVGVRLSDVKSLVADAKQSHRFRIEARWQF